MLSARSVETADGRGLETAVSATVAGPVGISVAARCAGRRSRRRTAGRRGYAQPRGGRRVDGRLRDGGRQRAGGRGLHGGERHAHVRGGRVVEDGRGGGARRRARRGRGNADERLGGPAGGRRGNRDDQEPGPVAQGAAGSLRAHGGGAASARRPWRRCSVAMPLARSG